MAKSPKNNESIDTNTASITSGTNPWPWIVGAIFVLGLAGLGGLYWSSTMKVQHIQFTGNHFVPTSELEKIEVPTGLNPDSMNFEEIRTRFEKIAYVKQANISVAPSGNLEINIEERQPIALLADGSTKIYVDEKGVRLPLKLGKTVDVPILYGFSATPMRDTLNSAAFKSVSDFLTTVKSKKVSNATISEVAWTEKKGVVALTNQNGVKLIFGKGDFETRLRNWEAFYGKVVKKKGIQAMRSIDLRFEGQIVTREKS